MINGISNQPFYQKILHVFLLSAFLFAQPLLNLIGDNVEFLVASNVGQFEVYILLFSLCALIPIAITIIELVARLLGQKVADVVHIAILLVLSISIYTLSLNYIDNMPGVMTVAIAIVLGIISCYAYVKFPTVRTYLNFLSPAIIVFPIFFLLNPQVTKITSSSYEQNSTGIPSSALAPVVMVIFDEFPVISLLDETGAIDPIRYPNFFSFANDAIWFRNATVNSGQTTKSIPAILSGVLPDNELLPIKKDHPQTLFTLLKESHEFEVYETATSLCPDVSCGGDIITPSLGSLRLKLTGLFSDISIIYLHLLLPEDFAKGLPVVTQNWKDFREDITHDGNDRDIRKKHWKVARPEGFAKFVNKIANSETPGLYFTHTMLPHVPWKYLPSGKEYMIKEVYSVPGLDIKKEQWGNNDWLVTQGYQRHLLQVGYIDKLLGNLLTRLKEQALYERSLIVITADHGVSFWPDSSRRGVTKPENRNDLYGVPLFIKPPNQKKGNINDKAMQSIDILPTLAHILGIEMPWKVDGKNILVRSNQENEAKAQQPYLDSKSLKRKIDIFGSGGQADKGLYRFGLYKELVGRDIEEHTLDNNNDVSFSIDQSEELSTVDFDSLYIPAYITGNIFKSATNSESLNLAIVLNGTVSAVTRSYPVEEGYNFSVIIPPSSLREGSNMVDILAITENSGVPFLSKLAKHKPKGSVASQTQTENTNKKTNKPDYIHDSPGDK